MKIWMVTGDRLETAESVSYACRLLQENYKKLYLTTGENIESIFLDINNIVKHYLENNLKIAVIVEGSMICNYILFTLTTFFHFPNSPFFWLFRLYPDKPSPYYQRSEWGHSTQVRN